MKLSEIKVPKQFKKTPPSPTKLIKCIEYYNEHGELDKPITINKNNVLVDGYVRYIVAQKMNIEDVPVIYHVDLNVYVKAKHRSIGKSYWWKVREKDKVHFIEKSHIGDHILVDTKKGERIVVIDEIVFRDKPPIPIQMKVVKEF